METLIPKLEPKRSAPSLSRRLLHMIWIEIESPPLDDLIGILGVYLSESDHFRGDFDLLRRWGVHPRCSCTLLIIRYHAPSSILEEWSERIPIQRSFDKTSDWCIIIWLSVSCWLMYDSVIDYGFVSKRSPKIIALRPIKHLEMELFVAFTNH